MREVLNRDDKLEVFPEFRYLIDMHSTWGGCELQVPPILSSQQPRFALLTQGQVCSTCIGHDSRHIELPAVYQVSHYPLDHHHHRHHHLVLVSIRIGINVT